MSNDVVGSTRNNLICIKDVIKEIPAMKEIPYTKRFKDVSYKEFLDISYEYLLGRLSDEEWSLSDEVLILCRMMEIKEKLHILEGEKR